MSYEEQYGVLNVSPASKRKQAQTKVIISTADKLRSNKEDITDLLCELRGVTESRHTDKEAIIAMNEAIYNLQEAVIKEIEKRERYGK